MIDSKLEAFNNVLKLKFLDQLASYEAIDSKRGNELSVIQASMNTFQSKINEYDIAIKNLPPPKTVKPVVNNTKKPSMKINATGLIPAAQISKGPDTDRTSSKRLIGGIGPGEAKPRTSLAKSLPRKKPLELGSGSSRTTAGLKKMPSNKSINTKASSTLTGSTSQKSLSKVQQRNSNRDLKLNNPSGKTMPKVGANNTPNTTRASNAGKIILGKTTANAASAANATENLRKKKSEKSLTESIKNTTIKPINGHTSNVTNGTNVANGATPHSNSEDAKHTENTEEEKKEKEKVVVTSPYGKGVDEADVSRLLAINTSLGDELLLHNMTMDRGNSSNLVYQPKPIIKRNLNIFVSEKSGNFGLISQFLSNEDIFTCVFLNKNVGKACISLLKPGLKDEITSTEAKIKALMSKSGDWNKEIIPFALSKGAVKAINLLDDKMYLKIFQSSVPIDDVFLMYKIFFTLLNNKVILDEKNKEKFWESVCRFFIDGRAIEEIKLGQELSTLISTFDFTPENIHSLKKLVGKHVNKISPSYFGNLCGTTGLFIFLIKDVLEYAGVTSDKKTQPSLQYKNLDYYLGLNRKYFEKLCSLEKLFG